MLCAAPAQAGDFAVDAAYARYSAVGMASWYGGSAQSGRTADGETIDMGSISAAHKTLPLPCYARVTNLRNGHSMVVRVNDRGPFVRGRIIDLSARAAMLLGFRGEGVARVKVDYLGKAPPAGSDEKFLLASLRDGSELAAAAPLAYATTANAKFIDAPALTALASAYRAANADGGVTAVPKHSPYGELKLSPYGDLKRSPFLELAGN